MSERSIYRPVDPAELAPETLPALPPGEIAPYTARNASRLAAFHNILRHVFESEQEQKVHNAPSRFGKVQNGKVTDAYLLMDGRYRYIWNHVAYRMYRDELAADRFTKIAADGIVFELKRHFQDGPPAMSVDRLRSLMEVDVENPTGNEGRGPGFDYEDSEGGRE